MQDAVFFALAGLFLLVPLVVFFLVIAAALAKRSSPSQKPLVSVPEGVPYGWEGYISLDYRKKPSRGFPAVLAVVAVVMLVVFSLYFALRSLVSGGIPPASANVSAAVSLPQLNLSFPEIGVNASGILQSSASFFSGRFFLVLAVVVLVLAVVFFLRRFKAHGERVALAKVKRPAVPAKVPAKAVKKSVSGKVSKSPSARSKQRIFFGRFAWLFGVVAVVALLSGIALLVYSVRGRVLSIAGFMLSSVFAVLSSVRDFAFVYRFYILAGIVALVIGIAVLRFFGSRR